MMKLSINKQILKEIVSINSTSLEFDSCKDALLLVQNLLTEYDISSKIDAIGKHSFLMAGDLAKAEVLFLSHVDVVGADLSFFSLKEKDGCFFGRGVFDMKGPMLATLEAFVSLPKNIQSRILFVVTSDEEIGGFQGTSKLTKFFKKIKLAIVPDGGSGENIVVSQRAPLHVRLRHEGVAAHASRPTEGINSLDAVARCCIELSDQISNCSLTMLSGGVAINKVPDLASAVLDIRIDSIEELEEVRIFLKTSSKKYNCMLEEIDKPLFFKSEKDDVLISRFQNLVGSKFVSEAGTSDARFLWSDLHIPIIVTSANGGGAHSNSEWVEVESLNKLATNIYNFIISL